MRRTNRKAKDESLHQHPTMEQELRNRDQLRHNDPEISLDEKIIRHLAKWAAFVGYEYCQVDGDILMFNDFQVSQYAEHYIAKQAPHLKVQRRDSHTNFHLKVSK